MLKFEAKKGDFAKIWQKLGGGGGYSPPSPPGSAAHVLAAKSGELIVLMSDFLFIHIKNLCKESPSSDAFRSRELEEHFGGLSRVRFYN